MRCLQDTARVVLALWLALAPVKAWAGSMTLLGAGSGSVVLPGPPTFAYGGQQLGSNASGVVTYSAVPIGTASGNRFVAFLLLGASSTTAPAAPTVVVNGSISATVTRIVSTGTNGIVMDVATAAVPTGTTASVVATYSVNMALNNIASGYTTDSTTLASSTPASVGGGNVTSATLNTQTVNVSQSGSVVLSGFYGFGITNGTQNFTTPNDPPVSRDNTFGSTMTGHSNGVSINASSNVSATWTTSAQGLLGLVVFR